MFEKGKPSPDFPLRYDAHVEDTIPFYHAFHTEIINLIMALDQEPRLWLDTGCGTGTLILKAMQSFQKTRFILADPSPEMIEVARNKLASKYQKRITFLQNCPTQEIVLGGGESPDIITAILCHHYLNSQARADATGNCYKLLKAGGIYITFENIRPFTLRGTEIGKSYWLNFQIASGKTERDAEKHIGRFDTEYYPITIDEHVELLHRCGFGTVELFWYSYMQAGLYCIK
jgi:tRNA (cmo5U34)-methyltransferase